MCKILKIKELIGIDIRSRSNAEVIKSAIDLNEDKVVLDFSEVTFISRAFADELCNVLDEFKNVELSNIDKDVRSMIDMVQLGRSRERERAEDISEIKEFDNMDGLSSFLLTI